MAIADGREIAAWVAAARQGDHAAFGCLVRQFQDAVAGVVLTRLGPGADVEDVTQEAFVAAYRNLGSLRQPQRFGAWICVIARNLALRWLRDRRPGLQLPADLEAPRGRKLPEIAERVMAAVASLPERLSEPLTLFYINGYTTGEVADMLKLPAGTVRRRLHEARNHLREHVEGAMERQIKRSAPGPDFTRDVLDRIAAVRIIAGDETGRDDQWVIVITDEAERTFPIMIGRREGQALEEALGQKEQSRCCTI